MNEPSGTGLNGVRVTALKNVPSVHCVDDPSAKNVCE